MFNFIPHIWNKFLNLSFYFITMNILVLQRFIMHKSLPCLEFPSLSLQPPNVQSFMWTIMSRCLGMLKKPPLAVLFGSVACQGRRSCMGNRRYFAKKMESGVGLFQTAKVLLDSGTESINRPEAVFWIENYYR